MASSEDTEITLGTGKLLVLFFGLVAICALFFALGYSLGRKSEPTMASASGPTTLPVSTSTAKTSSGSGAPPMTFYKAVEQKDARADLTPPAESKADTPSAPAAPTSTPPPQSTAVDPTTTLPSTGYFVQVAAVSKEEDAQALVDALKRKDYPAFVSAQSASDKLFRVQMGPFAEVKDAETMRTRLVADGYSPILKK
ncbi:MAG: SPOR domain-containing protein [Candidatus Sulfotelmatobacter sp.]